MAYQSLIFIQLNFSSATNLTQITESEWGFILLAAKIYIGCGAK